MGIGAKIKTKARATATGIRKDANFSRIPQGARVAGRRFRAGAGHYFLNKIPIYTWISAYVPVWLIGDAITGLSTGLVMFPRAVMFSALAGLPVQAALTASWLPSILYAAMGTSRDMSVGPVFMPSFIIGHTISSMKGSGLPPVLIAATLSLCVGIWSLLMGLLNLGFLFDSISVPIVLGFTCGMAIVAYMGQVAPLFGLVGVSPMLAQLTGQFIAKLPQTNLPALALGAGCIVFLVVLQKVGKKWGTRNESLRIATTSRNLFVLLLATAIGYIVNLHRAKPLWLTVGPVETDIRGVQGLSFQLVQKLFLSSFMLWFGIAIEHVLIAKALARMRGYTFDPSQELVHLGVSNIANSFMGGLPVGGGDMSSASVNATSGVRSPLSGLFVAAMVGAGMKPLSGFIKLIPLPAVAAVVIVATIDVMPSPGEMSKYWKWSFTDWATFLITFNTTLIVTPETGLEVGGAILAIYTLFRLILSRPRAVQCPDLESRYGILALPIWGEAEIPQGVFVMRLEHDLMFANAERIKKSIVDTAMMTHSAVPSTRNKNDRAWNDCIDKHVKYLRMRAGIRGDDRTLPTMQIVVLDLSAASFIDSSGLHAIEDIKSQLRSYGGADVEFRFVGLRDALQRRFDRAKWNLASPYDEDQETTADEKKTPADYVFDHLHHAIRMPSKRRVDSPAQEPLAWEKDDISIVNIGRPAVVARDMI